MKRLGRWVLILLALELVAAFWLGARIRARFEEPVRIIGSAPPRPGPGLPAALPLDILDARPVVLHAGEHEQEIG